MNIQYVYTNSNTNNLFHIYIVINYSVLEFYTRKQNNQLQELNIYIHMLAPISTKYIYHIYQIPFARISAPAN